MSTETQNVKQFNSIQFNSIQLESELELKIGYLYAGGEVSAGLSRPNQIIQSTVLDWKWKFSIQFAQWRRSKNALVAIHFWRETNDGGVLLSSREMKFFSLPSSLKNKEIMCIQNIHIVHCNLVGNSSKSRTNNRHQNNGLLIPGFNPSWNVSPQWMACCFFSWNNEYNKRGRDVYLVCVSIKNS